MLFANTDMNDSAAFRSFELLQNDVQIVRENCSETGSSMLVKRVIPGNTPLTFHCPLCAFNLSTGMK